MDSFGDNPTLLWLGAWGLSVAIAAGWWLAVRRLPPTKTRLPTANWRDSPLWFRLHPLDRVSLGLLAGLLVLLWLGRRDLFPVPPDGYYHLLVARNIAENGAIPLWNDWEFAPAGRPHLYPPLYHLLLVGVAAFHNGHLLPAFQDVQCFVLPFAHGCVWWLARWLFGAKRALLTLLLVGADPLLAITGMTASPSVIAGGLITLMLLFFLSGHPFAAAGAGVLSFYTHTGLAPMALLGIVTWSIWTRAPWRPLVLFLAPFGLVASPWAGWLLWHHNWFNHPIDLGLYGEHSVFAPPFLKIAWLQLLNIGLVSVVVRGLWFTNVRDPRNHFLLVCALAFLPMLLSYGGRYFAHTVHLWVILGSLAVAPLLATPVRKRALAVCAALALAPTTVVVGFGTVIPPGPVPLPSAWWFPPLAAAGGLAPLDRGAALGLFPYADAQTAAGLVREHTAVDSIVHTPGMGRDFALLMGFLAQRRIEKGGWEETRPDRTTIKANRRYALEDFSGSFVSRNPDNIPPGRRVTRAGSLYVGLPP